MPNQVEQNNREKDVSREWYLNAYLRDRKGAIALFAVTCFTFLALCTLYQLHNLLKVLYAFLIVSFIWVCCGIADYRRYRDLRIKIRLASLYPEQAELLFETGFAGGVHLSEKKAAEGLVRPAESCLEAAYRELVCTLSRESARLITEAETRGCDRMDYYMMWAHQIKTPIAAMKLLLNGRQDGSPLQKELFKIEQYVEMALHYLRLDSISSDMVLKEYDLHRLVRQSVRKFSVLFINSGLSFRLEEFDVKVLTDGKWLGFVLEQILSNSIKYTKKGVISIYRLPGSPQTLVIEDTGIGIRSEDLPRIFDRGFTGFNGRMEKRSTGIGLYLCRQIMDRLAHGIKVESEEGKGTRVLLDFSRESGEF